MATEVQAPTSYLKNALSVRAHGLREAIGSTFAAVIVPTLMESIPTVVNIAQGYREVSSLITPDLMALGLLGVGVVAFGVAVSKVAHGIGDFYHGSSQLRPEAVLAINEAAKAQKTTGN